MEKEWINQMFEQVSVNLHHLLDSLTFIYQSHGVEYTIKQYYDTLMRLLAPIQLLSPSNSSSQTITSNYVQKNKKNQQKQFSNAYQRKQIYRDQLQPKIQNKQYKRTKNYEKERQPKQNDRMQKDYREKGMKKSFYQMKMDEKRKQGYGRTTLSYDQQFQLANWIKDQFQNGHQVKSNQIANKAKMLSNNKMFQASSGWLRRFLNRNPSLKMLLQKDTFMPNLMQIREESSLYSQKSNKKIETWDEIFNSEYQLSSMSEQCPQFQEIIENSQNKKSSESQQEKKSQRSSKRNDKQKSLQLSQVIMKLQGAVKNHQSNFSNSNCKNKASEG